MGYTITKTTNGRLKFVSGFSAILVPASNSIIRTLNEEKILIEDLNGHTLITLDPEDVDSPLGTVVTPATFDFTGGAQEDLWTDIAHGFSVGDKVKLTAVGTGAPEYVLNTDYYVITIPTANTFQLSLTKGGPVVEGTSDGVGVWSFTNIDADDIAIAIEAL